MMSAGEDAPGVESQPGTERGWGRWWGMATLSGFTALSFFFWSAFTLAVFFQGHLPQLTARVLDHEDLHSDLVLPSGHTFQAIVRAAATTALHSHTAGH